MASSHVDPLQTLQAALHTPPDSQEQVDLLAALRESLEARPQPLPILCATLLSTVTNAEDSVLKRWILDLIHYGIARANLPIESRTLLASQSLDVLAGLLHDPSPHIVKIVVQTFACIYPLLFLSMCQNRNARAQWDTMTQVKTRILEFVWNTQPVSTGVRLAAISFLQRVILVQTRGVADPRLQNKNDPNLSMCPGDHPFVSVAALEAEGTQLLGALLTMLYTSPSTDVITAIVNSWANLVRLRTTHIRLVVTSLTSWTPNALAGQSYASIKSAEKAIRILLTHISRMGSLVAPFIPEINRTLAEQASRMEKAASEEKARKAAIKRPASSLTPTSGETVDAKRQKLNSVAPSVDGAASVLAAFDFTSLPSMLVTELIIANLQAFSEDELNELVNAYRQPQTSVLVPVRTTAAEPVPGSSQISVPLPRAPVAPPTEPAADRRAAAASTSARHDDDDTPPIIAAKEEPVDPLKMDIDDDVEEDSSNVPPEPMQEDDEAAAAVPDVKALLSLDLKVPPPREMDFVERSVLVKSSVTRIWDGAGDVVTSGTGGGLDLWMLLVVRLVTRGADPQRKQKPDGLKGKEKAVDEESGDQNGDGMVSRAHEQQDRLRATLFDYIMTDFSGCDLPVLG